MRALSRAALVATGIAVTALVASCTESGQALPSGASGQSSQSAPTSKAGQGSGDVRKVTNPLNPTAYLDKPCALLPNEFVMGLGYDGPGKSATDSKNFGTRFVGPSCTWEVSDDVLSLQVQIFSGNRRRVNGSLEGLHSMYERGYWEYWDPTTVSGYPAAFGSMFDNRDAGTCSLVVGIAKNRTFGVIAGPYTDQPEKGCTVAKKTARQVIKTLKGSQ